MIFSAAFLCRKVHNRMQIPKERDLLLHAGKSCARTRRKWGSMDAENDFVPKIKLTIRRGTSFFGPGIAELLTLLESSGSMKEACRTMGLSYTKGWRIVNTAEENLGYDLIVRQHGGTGGGASCLTDRGKNLLEKYYGLEKEVMEFTGEAFRRTFPEGL